MKKVFTHFTGLFLALFFVLGAWQAEAQTVASYNFSQSAGTYTAITGGTLYTAGSDNVVYGGTANLIPFTFTYMGISYTSFRVSTNGFITLGNAITPSASNYTPISSTATSSVYVVSALGADLYSAVRYEVLGTTPNRVAVIQWSNAYRYSPGPGSSESLNFQIRLYETTNNIDVVYGPMTTLTSTTAVGQVGLRGNLNSDFNNVSFTNATLTGYPYTRSWSNLISASVNTDAVVIGTGLSPISGTTLSWTPSVCTQPTVSATATAIGNNTVTVNWTDNAAYASGYNVRWRKVDELPTVASWANPTVVASGSSSYVITGLVSSTYYIYSVEGLCSGSSKSNISRASVSNLTNTNGLVRTALACPGAPSALVASSVTTSSATLSWTAGSPAPSNGYQWEVRTSGAGGSGATGLVTNGSVSAGIVTDNVSGLSASTTYSIYVRSNCGSGDFSSWTGPVGFSTPCANYILNVSEGFNTSGTAVFPTCWSQQFVTGTSNLTFQASSTNPTTSPNEGTRHAYWNSYIIAAGNSTRLVSPPVTTTGTASVDVEFQWFHDNTAYTTAGYADEGVYVEYSTNGSTWTTVGSQITRLGGTNGWNLKTVTLPAGAANQATVYVGFRFLSRNGNNCSLDAVVIKPTPSCAVPTVSAATLVTSSSATLNWTAGSGSISGYNWEVRTSGASGSGATGLTASGSVGNVLTAATGATLAANTAYSVYVQTNCGGPTSTWGGPVTFTTACANYILNVSEGFNTTGTAVFPTCWTQQYVVPSTGGSNITFDPSSGNPAVSAYGGSGRYVRWNSYSISSGRETRLVSPPITTTGTANISVDFRWFHDNGYPTYTGEGVVVQFSTDGATWTDAGALIPRYHATATGWNLKTVNLPVGAGNQATVYIGFKFVSQLGNNCSMDEVLIYPTPACLPPTVIAATNVLAASATINWSASPSSPAGYSWELRTSGVGGSGAGAGFVASGSTTTALTANLTGLAGNTTYSVYVQADCGINQSSWNGPVTFTTPCTAVTAFVEDFEATTGTLFPACWARVGTAGNAYTQANTGIAGARNVYIFNGAVVRMRPVSNGGANTHWLRFKQRANLTAGGILEVGYLTDPNNDATFVSVSTYTTTSTTASEITIDLGTAPGANQVLAFRAGTSPANSILLDDVNWEAKPTCYPPTALGVATVTNSGASASWTAPVSGTTPASYNWKVVASGAGSGGAAVSSGSPVTTSATIAGLGASTSYDFWLQSNCGGGDLSSWAGPIAFTTACNNYALTVTEGFNTTGAAVFPTCWTQQYVVPSTSGSNLTFDPSSGNPAVSAFGGSGRYVRWNSYSIASGRETRLVSPPITTTGVSTSVSVDFQWYHDNGYSTYTGEGVQVQYSLDGTTWVDAGAFITRYHASLTGWRLKTIILPAAATNQPTVYVGFKFVSQLGNNCSLDQAVIYETPSCLPPVISAATNLTQSTATINWTASISTVGVGYEWEVRTSGVGGSGAGAGFIASGSTGPSGVSANLTGLTSLTTYQVYVRSLCTATPINSSWGGPATFTTATANPYCNATGIPIPDLTCYELPILVTGAPGNNLGTNSFLEEARLTVAHTWDADLDISLISPSGVEIDLTSDNGGSGDNYGTVPVICPVTSGYTAFKMGAASVIGGTAPFIGTYAPEGNFSAFNGVNPNGTWKLKVCDDAAGAPGTLHFAQLVFVSCLSPTVVATTAITNSTATINWTGPSPAPAGYQYEVRLSGAAGSGATGLISSGTTTTAVTANVSGLAIGNTYTVYVRSNCGGSFSAWASNTFMTPPANVSCATATTLPCGTVNLPGTTNLTTSGPVPGGCSMSGYGVWYTFVGDGNISVLSATNVSLDLELSVVSGSCGGPYTSLGCVDDFAAGTETFAVATTPGLNYYVYIAHYSSSGTTRGNFTISRTCYPPLTNNPCASAIPVSCGSVTAGHNFTATTDAGTAGAACSGVYGDASVWYSVVGTGYSMTVSTCGGPVGFDSEVTVFSGTCGSLTCVGGNDDFCGNLSSYTFTSVYNQTYLIRVSGYFDPWDMSTPSMGAFNLTVSCINQNVWTGSTSTAWAVAGNWSPAAVPLNTQAAIIPTNPIGGVFPTISSAASVDKLVMKNGATVNVVTGGSITVGTHLDNNGILNIANAASLVQLTGGTLLGTGSYKVERMGGSMYDYWSSPITTGSLGMPSYLYNPLTGTYDTSDDYFDPGWQAAPSIMTPGRGYAAHGAGYKAFQGTVNNGNIAYPVQFVNNPPLSPNPGVAWNLIGNPYPSGITVSSFLTANSGILAVGSVYLWDDPGTVPYVGAGYASINAAGIAVTGAGGNTPTSTLSSCQGFKVKVNAAGNVNFTNAMRTATNPVMLFREAEAKTFWLSATSSENRYNQTAVGFYEDGTDEVDWAYDTPKLDPVSDLSLYSFIGTEPFAIQGYGPFDAERVVPLGLASGFNTQITFALDQVDNMENDLIILEDRSLGVYHDLHESSYIFQAGATQYLDRFFVHFMPAQVTGVRNADQLTLRTYLADELLHVFLSDDFKGQIEIMDMNGKQVLSSQLVISKNSIAKFDVSELSRGVYTVRVVGNGVNASKKVFK